jgi:hypothetical protein
MKRRATLPDLNSYLTASKCLDSSSAIDTHCMQVKNYSGFRSFPCGPNISRNILEPLDLPQTPPMKPKILENIYRKRNFFKNEETFRRRGSLCDMSKIHEEKPRSKIYYHQTFIDSPNQCNNNGKSFKRMKYQNNDEIFEKPPISYSGLIVKAIISAPNAKLTLSGIISWISLNFPFYGICDSKWHNAIKQNLASSKFIIKLTSSKTLDSNTVYYTVDPEQLTKFEAKQVIPLGSIEKLRPLVLDLLLKDGNTEFLTLTNDLSIKIAAFNLKKQNAQIISNNPSSTLTAFKNCGFSNQTLCGSILPTPSSSSYSYLQTNNSIGDGKLKFESNKLFESSMVDTMIPVSTTLEENFEGAINGSNSSPSYHILLDEFNDSFNNLFPDSFSNTCTPSNTIDPLLVELCAESPDSYGESHLIGSISGYQHSPRSLSVYYENPSNSSPSHVSPFSSSSFECHSYQNEL